MKKRIEKHTERFSYLNICQEEEEEEDDDVDLSKEKCSQKDLNLNLEFYCDFDDAEKGKCFENNNEDEMCFMMENIMELENNNVEMALSTMDYGLMDIIAKGF